MLPPLTAPHAQALLAAIAETPSDPAPRLILADWLEERGDPRAPWVRDAALWEFMAPDAHDPGPGLLDRMSTLLRDDFIRVTSLLRVVGSHMVSALRSWLRQDSKRTWGGLLALLAEIPPLEFRPVSDLIADLGNANRYRAYEAAVDLAFLGPAAAEAVQALAEAVQRGNYVDRWMVCRQALRALSAIGPAALSALPQIMSRLTLFDEGDHDSDVPEIAAGVVRSLRPSVEELYRVLNFSDGTATDRSLMLLRDLDPTHCDALARVVCEHDKPVPRHSGAMLLGNLGERAAPAVPALLRTLQQSLGCPRPQARYETALALGKIGPAARVAIPVLREALGKIGDSDEMMVGHVRVRHVVAQALARLGDPLGLETIRADMGSGQKDERTKATRALSALIPTCPEAFEVMRAAMGDPSSAVRLEVVDSWRWCILLNNDQEQFIGPLLTALSDRSEKVRLCTLKALEILPRERLGDPAVVAALTQKTTDPRERVRQFAARLLQRCQPTTK